MADNGALSEQTSPPSANLGSLPGGSAFARFRALTAQPAIRKSLPMVAGLLSAAAAGLLYLALADGPQRVLYSSLSDVERADVAASLDKSGISYNIENATGALTVAEDDLYRARMLVASDGGLAAPESTAQMLDAIPIGSSRTLEGERLRNVRERELMMTIMEIEGVEAVRVHLAQAEKSVFVRESTAPSASVMVRMARGRNLGEDQVKAIVSLVAGSVPGMNSNSVRVADQHGNLLTDIKSSSGAGLELQAEYEMKMRAQIAQLLVPMLGEGNFSTEVQVELDMDDTTSARESYEKEGVVRSETSRESSQTGGAQAGGVPGVLANTPPPETQIAATGEQTTTNAAASGPTSGETSAQRTYELGREVAVSTSMPGGVKRISVAVAVSSDALKKIAPATAAQIEKLVASALGVNTDRGDEVTVLAGKFEPALIDAVPFYETAWFATILRNGVALIAVILALLFGIRPLIRAVAGRQKDAIEIADDAGNEDSATPQLITANNAPLDPEILREQVGLAQKLAAEQPDRAVEALRRMLAAPDPEKAA